MANVSQQIGSSYGSRPIDGTDEITCSTKGIYAYQAFQDTVITSLKDSAGTEMLTKTKWNAKTIPAGHTIFFGFPAVKNTLTSGNGTGYNSKPLF